MTYLARSSAVPAAAVPIATGPGADPLRWAPPARRLWPATVSLVAGLAVATVVLRIGNRATPVDTWWLGNLGMTCGLGLVGALVSRRLPANPLGWFLLAGALGEGLTGFGREYTVHAVATDPGSLPWPQWAAWAASWGSLIGLATLPLVLLHFPDGRPLTARWRWVTGYVLVATAGAVVTSATSPGEFTTELPGLVNPLGVDRPWLEVASTVSFVALQLGTLAAYASLLRRWHGAPPATRRQLRWTTITAGALVVDAVAEGTPLGEWPAFEWLGPLMLLLFIVSIGLAVLRHHLWDIDVVVNVSLVYAILTIALSATFVAVVALTSRHDGQSLLWPSVLALGVVAVGFLPLRRAVQHGVDRVLYGRRANPDRVLSGLGERLADPDQPDRVLTEAVEAIAAAHLRLDYVGLRVTDSSTVVATGRARTDKAAIPLVYQGVRVGELELAARPGTRLPRQPRELLGGTVEALAAVVHAVTVTRAVHEARHALLAAREEERRRLRRDLHDGLGPALAAIAMQADAAALLTTSAPERSREVMTAVAADVRTTIEDVRRLVYDLQPPVLDAVGLVAAVRERAVAFSSGEADSEGPGPSGRTSAPGLRVEVDAPPTLGALPAAVETAAYRIVCEAVTNVARHSTARRCLISLARATGPDAVQVVWVVVDDDGVGLAPGGPTRRGVGIPSMVGRAGELGGSCRLSRSPWGGVRVEALLPVTRTEAGGG